MAHKEDTAVKYYRLSEKAQASVKASQTLHTMMRKRAQQLVTASLKRLRNIEKKLKKPWSKLLKNKSMKTSRKVKTVLHLGHAGPWPQFKKFARSLEKKYRKMKSLWNVGERGSWNVKSSKA